MQIDFFRQLMPHAAVGIEHCAIGVAVDNTAVVVSCSGECSLVGEKPHAGSNQRVNAGFFGGNSSVSVCFVLVDVCLDSSTGGGIVGCLGVHSCRQHIVGCNALRNHLVHLDLKVGLIRLSCSFQSVEQRSREIPGVAAVANFGDASNVGVAEYQDGLRTSQRQADAAIAGFDAGE